MTTWVLEQRSVVSLTTTDGIGPLGLSRPQRGTGDGKGAEEQCSLALTGPCRGRTGLYVRALAFGYGAVEESGAAHSPVQSDSPVRPQRKQRQHKETKQAGEASWLK